MKKSKDILFSLALLTGVFYFSSCTYDKVELKTDTGYPPEVGKIIIEKCATTGCHTTMNRDAVGGLAMETWDKLFEGARGGSVVIPFRPDFSTLLYYTNTDTSQGLALEPTMPFNAPALSQQEYLTLQDWITQGAPDKNSFVKFSDNQQQKKFYIGNQGCDEVAVFDAKSMLAIRYIAVGSTHSIESPHMIKVSPDNQYWCASFLGTEYFQKFSTADNQLLGQVNLTIGSWKSFTFSSDSRTAYVIDWSYGRIAVVDIDSMTVQLYSGLSSPNGCALNATDDTLYVTSEIGNFIYKIPVNNLSNINYVSVNGLPADSSSALIIHDILFSVDGSKYFITCEGSNEVRVIKTGNDSLLAVIPTGTFPQEMAFSNSFPYLFVSCTNDFNTFPGEHGSVYIINYENFSIVGSVHTGHEPQGIAVDDLNKRVYVCNRNISVDGPPPHHGSQCAGKNGYVSAIDLTTLQLINGFRTEVSVDPYCIAISN